MKHLWGVKELAEHCGVPELTVYEWRRYGKGPPAYKIGKHLRFDPDEVADWVRSQRIDAAPQVPA